MENTANMSFKKIYDQYNYTYDEDMQPYNQESNSEGTNSGNGHESPELQTFNKHSQTIPIIQKKRQGLVEGIEEIVFN